ncbi:MAG: pyruvate formate lyase family protein [Breznakia sp.]
MNITLNYLLEFTYTYKRFANDKYRREVECTRLMQQMNRQDVSNKYYISLFPQAIVGFGSRQSGFMYYAREEKFEALLSNKSLTLSEQDAVKDCYRYWKNKNDLAKIRKLSTDEFGLTLRNQNYMQDYGISYPLYRLGGAYVDFKKLVDVGLDGLLFEIDQMLLRKKTSMLKAAKRAILVIQETIELYMQDIKNKIDENNENLLELYQSLETILHDPPKNIRQALQLMWIYIGFSEVRNYGRLDIILRKFADEVDSSYQDIEEYFKVIQERNTITNGRIIIGGKDICRDSACDKIALITMMCIKKNHFIEPQLTLRYCNDTNKDVWEMAMKCIADGCTYPLLYNDDEIIWQVMKTLEVDEETALDYVPFGCGEYIINHKTIGSPNEIINLSKLLESYLNDGKCMLSNQKLVDYVSMPHTSFHSFYNGYLNMVKEQVNVNARHAKFVYDYMSNRCAYIYNSILYDCCLTNSKSLLDGSIQGISGTLETYGNINTCDSLYTIKKLVYEDEIVSLEQVKKILKSNFNGYEDIYEKCKNVVKYGNGNEQIDAFVSSFHQNIAEIAKQSGKKYGLGTYSIVVINNDANSHLGYLTAASFDGRKEKEPLSNALSPQAGAEKSSLLAALKSVSSVDLTNIAGAVFNLKLNKDLLRKHTENMSEIVKTFFKEGGTQIMISVVNNKELQDALVHPERYPNLIVRVGGFSTHFVRLPRIVQEEIISRSEY